ncbi:MAG: molybdenum cofactor guanylyltransferase [Candidatus Accumulibacter sp.]|jgi:molybdopterin-guanine dinucleotide biosynthesis protein A|nr:molybdenum cofactor guanylyltransferase [Accumulibacter sp.]
MIADCTGLILAGGDSRRMGRDKTALEFGGRTLLARAIDLMQGVFPQVLVSVRHARGDIAATQVFDELPDAGPLAGLCAGLACSRTPWVFVMAADMPFLEAGVIRELAARRDDGHEAVVPVVGDVPQPLAAYYATTALPTLRAILAGTGGRGPRDALARLNAVYVHENRPHDFIDLDTPEDVTAAERGSRG